MNTSEDWLNILDPAKVVNDLIIDIVGGVVGGVVIAIVLIIINDRFKKKKHIRSISPEIEVNQNQLKPLSDFVIKVLDGNGEYTEEDKLPNELIFEHGIYSALADKLGILDDETINKLVEYYSDIKHIEEQYKEFGLIHGNSYDSLVGLELTDTTGRRDYRDGFPRWSEIEEFIRPTKKVYDLGEELIISLKG